ncbi:MAG: hypothetical protein E7421_00405 [Ruminococcaceae bacterium]|nr:hypothetical protein [Oscillospiraceae bacterium]
MRKTTDLFLIDGRPILAPDENVEISLEDIDASDSGRDESGVMHRFVVRQGVGKWTFSYACLTGEEYAYMESLFAGKATFCFRYSDCADGGQAKEITAYRSKHGIVWQSAATGQFRNYQFSIIQC